MYKFYSPLLQFIFKLKELLRWIKPNKTLNFSLSFQRVGIHMSILLLFAHYYYWYISLSFKLNSVYMRGKGYMAALFVRISYKSIYECEAILMM
jgi:hypothetical protein